VNIGPTELIILFVVLALIAVPVALIVRAARR
jgi:hypothetical protein